MNWKQCVSLGLCSVGEYKAEPVAFLYNGVRLPKLPETVLPYAFMYKRSETAQVTLVLLDVLPQYGGWLSPYVSWKNSITMYYHEDSGRWVYRSESESFSGAVEDKAVFWSNVDIVNALDETVFLKATDPIPVYA